MKKINFLVLAIALLIGFCDSSNAQDKKYAFGLQVNTIPKDPPGWYNQNKASFDENQLYNGDETDNSFSWGIHGMMYLKPLVALKLSVTFTKISYNSDATHTNIPDVIAHSVGFK